MPEGTDVATGEAVLEIAVRAAERALGQRLLAAYALGSLAHGGFSVLVSDVDLGLILSDPLGDDDANAIEDVSAKVKASAAPLADRLSVFWGSGSSLTYGGSLGRFPPLDRLDLLRHGRLLQGTDERSGLPKPSHQDLVVEASRFCLNLLPRYDLKGCVRDPAALLAKDARSYTKTVLFPVRFLYTARTGEIGRNHDAVEHMVTNHPSPAAGLAAAALKWRETPASSEGGGAAGLLREGLIPLYLSCLQEHELRMRKWGEEPLAAELRASRDRLEAG